MCTNTEFRPLPRVHRSLIDLHNCARPTTSGCSVDRAQLCNTEKDGEFNNSPNDEFQLVNQLFVLGWGGVMAVH